MSQIPTTSAWGQPLGGRASAPGSGPGPVTAGSSTSGTSGRGATQARGTAPSAPVFRHGAPTATALVQGGEGRATVHRGGGDVGGVQPTPRAGKFNFFCFSKRNLVSYV